MLLFTPEQAILQQYEQTILTTPKYVETRTKIQIQSAELKRIRDICLASQKLVDNSYVQEQFDELGSKFWEIIVRFNAEHPNAKVPSAQKLFKNITIKETKEFLKSASPEDMERIEIELKLLSFDESGFFEAVKLYAKAARIRELAKLKIRSSGLCNTPSIP